MESWTAWDRLRFWWRANNQYGVHSPFLYAFLTKSLYRKPRYAGPQYWQLTKKCIDHFGPQQLWVHGSPQELPEQSLDFREVNLSRNPLTESPSPFLLLLLRGDFDLETLNFNDWPENCMVIIANIREEKQRQLWEEMKQIDSFRMTAEFSRTGWLVIRPGQQKEHFSLRF